MTDIELAQPKNPGLPAKLEYARFLATSGLLPAQYRDRPGNILWATEYGEMLGLRPMAAITGIHVIEGKPSASAALISALVRRAGHRLRVSGDDEKAIAEIVRADDTEFVYRAEWTIARARQAELTGKGTWKKYPAAMLKARAITEVARDACEEALMGMHYTPEELGEETDAEGTPVRATATQDRPADPDWPSKPATAHERATGQPEPAQPERDWDGEIEAATGRKDADALRALWRDAKGDVALRERIAAASRSLTDPDAPADGEVVDAEIVAADAVLGATVIDHQHQLMDALWGKADVTGDERVQIAALLIGREVDTLKDLTEDEAATVIKALEKADAGGPAVMYRQVTAWIEQYAAPAE
ncbi:MAG: recombinase RecT, partial [Phycicoccus sp.]